MRPRSITAFRRERVNRAAVLLVPLPDGSEARVPLSTGAADAFCRHMLDRGLGVETARPDNGLPVCEIRAVAGPEADA